jgi:hypothetical protein
MPIFVSTNCVEKVRSSHKIGSRPPTIVKVARPAYLYLHLTVPSRGRILSGVGKWNGMSLLASERAREMKREVASPFHRTTRLEAAALRHITQAKRLRNSHMSWISMSKISSDSTNPIIPSRRHKSYPGPPTPNRSTSAGTCATGGHNPSLTPAGKQVQLALLLTPTCSTCLGSICDNDSCSRRRKFPRKMSNPQKSSDCEMQESRIGNLTYRLSRGIGYRNLLTEVDVVVDDTGTQIRLPFGSRNRARV